MSPLAQKYQSLGIAVARQCLCTEGALNHLTLPDLAWMVALGAMLSAKHPSLNATLSTTWTPYSRHFAILLVSQQKGLASLSMKDLLACELEARLYVGRK
jgi:hypothetical protein